MQHPAFSGHFPGVPIVPGVVLLDETLHALNPAADGSHGHWEIAVAKFHSVARPGEALTLEHEHASDGSIRFVIRSLDRTVASGRLCLAQAARGAGREA